MSRVFSDSITTMSTVVTDSLMIMVTVTTVDMVVIESEKIEESDLAQPLANLYTHVTTNSAPENFNPALSDHYENITCKLLLTYNDCMAAATMPKSGCYLLRGQLEPKLFSPHFEPVIKSCDLFKKSTNTIKISNLA